MEAGTGAGVICEGLNLSCSFKLPNRCSVIQAAVLAIYEAAKAIVLQKLPRPSIVLYSDSWAALGILAARITKSKLVRCRQTLNDLVLRHHNEICWDPGHTDIEGSELADERTRAGQ